MKLTEERGIGLMCGTSHDGVDIADVSFREEFSGIWTFELHAGRTFPLPNDIKQRLRNAANSSALAMVELDRDVAQYFAACIEEFRLENDGDKMNFIASHGITIFHQPGQRFTTQIGSGAIISSLTGLSTVCDFRQQDVSLGGQGAPLVPSCDAQLFPGFQYTLNLGGFANISVLTSEVRGFDVGPCTLVLDALAQKRGKLYDEGGMLARQGREIPSMLHTLNDLPFYKLTGERSLGTEWITEVLEPIMERFCTETIEDQLRTFTEHIAMQIGNHLKNKESKVLCTGGGTFNDYLIERLKVHSEAEIIKPSDDIINYREAICFAFLGMMRLLGRENVRSSSTGALRDSCSGAVYLA